MSDQTKENLAEILEGNPEILKSFIHRYDLPNPSLQSQQFIFISEAIRNIRIKIAKMILEKMLVFDIKRQPGKKFHLVIKKSDEFNHFCNLEDPFVDAVKISILLESTIFNDDLKILEILLDKGINSNPYLSNHLLHFAVENNSIEFVKLLLNRGADVNARNSEYMTPLHVATMKRFFTIAEELLDKGADVNSTTYQLRKKNMKICYNDEDTNERIMKRLLKKGTIAEEVMKIGEISGENDVDFAYEKLKTRRSYYASSILFAIQNDDLAMTKLLLNRGADVLHNPNLLNVVLSLGNLDIIECFTKRDIDINNKGEEEETALHRAVLISHPEDLKVEIIKLLLNRGANVQSRNKSGQTPLHLAAQKGYAKLVVTLLEYQPDVHDLRSSQDKLSEFLLPHKRDLRSKNQATQFDANKKNDATQIGIAVKKDNAELAGSLISKFEQDEDNSRNSEDCSARFLILQKRAFYFKNKAAQLHAKNNIGETALHMASSRNHQEVVEILVKYGIDIDCKTIFGKTALDVAFENGCRQTFIVLLKYGSDIDVNYTANIPDENRPSFCFIKSHRGEFIMSNKYCVENIIKHIVRIKTGGRFVSNGNLKCLAKNDETFNSYYRECDEEIEKLKKEKIGKNISFYDVLRKSCNQLASYARNELIVQAIESKHLKDKFPIYSDMIYYNFKRGQMRELLINISLNSLNSSIEYYLPPEVVVTDIFRYLRNEDLVNLVEACNTSRI